ncbi:hypothetical protein AFLA_000454 [Aspergillus flavus NRRL3357]|nr:uncharacterized protein G4B84_003857 [Aspergillus flavus NRRL3357]KAF7618807.1 hypothetical protein AFLA_000454 [Aspergillus flavus NRRL3357]QMW28568.1 hypothetical protein G4B84_003857 [Aspergillus flavus NRRL3357]
MHYVYYASLYTVWALMPVGIPDRGWWAEMAKFLEECLMVIQLGGDDRFKIKKVNPVVDEAYETGEGSNCGGGFRGCAGDEYSEDEGLSEDDSEEGSEQERDSEGSHTDDEDASEVETVIDEEGHVSDEGDDEGDDEEEEVRESDMAGQGDGHTPEIVIRISMEAGGQVESNEERLRQDAHGHGHRDPGFRAWALKNLAKYGTTFHWDDENGEPTFDDVRYQLRQKVCHDLREIDLKLRGRVYSKPALGFR